MRALFLFLIAGLAVTGCDAAEPDTLTVAVIDTAAAPFASDGRSRAAEYLARATREGLVAYDAYGRIVPALADRWIVTDDGTSYIFRLRDGVWADGERLDAASARAALSAAIAQQRGTPLGADLGRITQVRAMAGRVLEIRLNHPVPELLAILARPELGLARAGVGAGPMRATVEDRGALLSPIPPEQRGLPGEEGWAERARDISLLALPAARAVDAFADGKVRVVLGGTVADFFLADRTGLSRGALRIDDVEGLFGLAFVHRDGFLEWAENRAALAMAVDRAALMAPFGIGNWRARLGILPGPGQGQPTLPIAGWRDLTLEQRRATAAQRVARWRSGGKQIAPIRIALPGGPGGAQMFRALAGDFSAIGLESMRVPLAARADLRLLDIVAPGGGPEWYLNRFRCGLRDVICSTVADYAMREARQENPRIARDALLEEAVAAIESEQLFIAFGQPIRWSLVGGNVTGFQTNGLGVHPLIELAMRTR